MDLKKRALGDLQSTITNLKRCISALTELEKDIENDVDVLQKT